MAEPLQSHRGATWVMNALVAVVMLLLLGWLVQAYPLGVVPAAVACGLVATIAWARADLALALPLALLPVAGLAPLTGWLVAEEFDLVVLAALVGGYGRMAVQPPDPPIGGSRRLFDTWVPWVLPWLAGLWAIGLWRGFDDAGGATWSWWQGYREPLNSLRLAKPWVGALMWWWLWRQTYRRDPSAPPRAVVAGTAAALGLVGLAVLWERAAFAGLLNFSTDYRTTALFWEMHVGGAALDGFIAVAIPMAAHHACTAQRRWEQVVSVVGLALASYVALTTFSRIVYLAVPVALLVMGAARVRDRPWQAPGTRALAAGVAVVLALFALGAWWIFPGSGYRGLLAWLACWILVLPLVCMAPALERRAWWGGSASGVVLAVVVLGLGAVVPKGAYLAFGLAACLTAGVSASLKPARAPWMLAGNIACWAAAVMVAWHWGGEAAGRNAGAALAAMPLVLAAASHGRGTPWPIGRRGLGLLAAVFVATSAVVAVFAGGAYMAGRVASSGSDLDDRGTHWRRSLDLLGSDVQRAFGLGFGRYVDHYAMQALRDRPGDYRLVRGDAGSHLVMVAGTHVQGWGELLRVSQRLPVPEGVVQVRVRVRASSKATVHFDLCRKHLLYDAGCQVAQLTVPDSAGQWQVHKIELRGKPLQRDGVPVLAVFSLGPETPSVRVELDDLQVLDQAGHPLLGNGDFEQGLARWLFSSDRHHMPWHAKNMAVHLWVESGLFGLCVVGGAVLLALGRLAFGRGRDHPLAPAIAAGLVGFLVVGAVDSLFDMPRVAWLFVVWLLVALDLRSPGVRIGSPAAGRAART